MELTHFLHKLILINCTLSKLIRLKYHIFDLPQQVKNIFTTFQMIISTCVILLENNDQYCQSTSRIGRIH